MNALLGVIALGATIPGGVPAAEQYVQRAYTIRDSAGVEVIENRSPRLPLLNGWKIGEEPTLQIGTQDGASASSLFRVGAARMMSDGRIAILDGGSKQIRVFGPEGVFEFSAGGEGDGPGRFQYLYHLQVLPGDTLLAFDASHLRVTLFDSSGELLETIAIRHDEPSPNIRYLTRLPDGTHLTQIGVNSMYLDRGDGFPRGLRTVYRLAPDGTQLAEVVTVESGEGFVIAGGRTTMANPFSRSGRTLPAGDLLLNAFSGEYEYSLYSLEGDLVRVARRGFIPTPIPEGEIRDWIDRVGEPNSRFGLTPQALGALDYPDTRPVFEDVLVDTEENVWIQDYRPEDATGPPLWSVFAADGVWVSRVVIPEDLRPVEIGSDYILAIWRDEYGVEYVRRYDLIKGA